jgi:hypothetical protein
MAGVKQQISSFCFIAAYEDVAPGKPQPAGVLNNEFRARSCRNGLLETMKTLVIKKNFQFQWRTAEREKWRRDKKI